MSFSIRSIAVAALLAATAAQADLTLQPGQSATIAGQRIYCSYGGGGGGGWEPPPGGGWEDPRACRLLGRGSFNGFSYAYRLQPGRNAAPVDASDSLSTILSKMENFIRYGTCNRPYRSNCELTGRGNYGGFSYAYILEVDREQVYASDSLNSIISVKEQLGRAGFCSERTYRSCRIGGPVNYGGFSYRYSVEIDGRTVYATDSMSSAQNQVDDLRRAEFCR